MFWDIWLQIRIDPKINELTIYTKHTYPWICDIIYDWNYIDDKAELQVVDGWKETFKFNWIYILQSRFPCDSVRKLNVTIPLTFFSWL